MYDNPISTQFLAPIDCLKFQRCTRRIKDLKQGCEWTDKSMNRDRESRPRLGSDGSFFGDSFSNLEIDDNVRILHNLGLDPAGNISPALAFQHDRDSRDRDRDNIRIFLKCLELLVSVETLRHVPSRC